MQKINSGKGINFSRYLGPSRCTFIAAATGGIRKGPGTKG